MTVSRWKVMAGVLGVSLGGLAALAGQAPKTGDARRAESPPESPMPAAPKLVPPAPSFDVPPPAGLPVLPSAPSTAAPAALPPLPMLGEPPTAAADKKPTKLELTPVAGFSLPGVPVVPAGGAAPPLPTPFSAVSDPTPPKPTPVTPLLPVETKPVPAIHIDPPALGGVTPPSVPPSAIPSPAATPPLELPTPATSVPAPTRGPPAASEPAAPIRVAPAAAVVNASKFRIILRVGEGEPTFEVRSGDDLLMKVACEKVDIASAEKGQPMQQVKASGKVRFVGFGSEGTCDELAFVAGTGELQLAGNVTIQVKDKLGRVDSELKSDKVKYKIDASAMPGVMKP